MKGVKLEDIMNNYIQMGFSPPLVKKAWEECKNPSQMLEILIQMNNSNSKTVQDLNKPRAINNFFPNNTYQPNTLQKNGTGTFDDFEINKAIEASLKEAKNKDSIGSYEPLNPEQRLRKALMPVGLKNIGNTCYVNSLFQTYFSNFKLVKAILEFNPKTILDNSKTLQAKDSGGHNSDLKQFRINASVNLVKNLQKLFSMMIRSHKKYVDPTNVLNTIVDDLGSPIPIGDQKDVTEFNINFLSRLDEGLQQQQRDPKQVNFVEDPMNSVSYKTSFLKKHSMIIVSEDNIINNMYFGQMKELKYFIEDGEKMAQEEATIFGPIILDILHKDLYTSWQESMIIKIDDYRLPNGEKTKAEKSNWIVRAPNNLFFQLQRVIFDKENGIMKVNTPFKFEKEIFIDRFLLKNKELASKIKLNVDILKQKLEMYEQQLAQINNYNQSNIDILKILDLTSEFLKNQFIEQKLDMAQRIHRDLTKIGMIDERENVSTCLSIISQYKQYLETKKDDIEKQIEITKNEIEYLYASLKTEKYHLVSILIHDGLAGSGHYYSFIRDIQTDTWKRYNDIQVTDEKEEIVMKEALGGYNNTNAYCFVYISDVLHKEELKLKEDYNMRITKSPIDKAGNTSAQYFNSNVNNNNNGDNNEMQIYKNYYSHLLSEEQKIEVDLDNIAFKDEIEEYKFQNFLKNMLEEYQARYDIILSHYQDIITDNYQPMDFNIRLPLKFDNFGLYLKSDMNIGYYNYDRLLKWYILDTTLQDKNKPNLRDIRKNEPKLMKILENRLYNLVKPYFIDNLILNMDEDIKLETKLTEYMNELHKIIFIIYIIQYSCQEKWLEALTTIRLLNDIEKNLSSFVIKLVRDVGKIILLVIIFQVEYFINMQMWFKVNQIQVYSDIILFIAKTFFKQDSIIISQLLLILAELITSFSNTMPINLLQIFKDTHIKLKNISNPNVDVDKSFRIYMPKEVEQRLTTLTTEVNNPYKWKYLDDFILSAELKSSLCQFRDKYKVLISMINKLYNYQKQPPLKLDERAKYGYCYSENTPATK